MRRMRQCPPASPCDDAFPPLATLVASCSSTGTFAGSSCEGAYDGAARGYLSLEDAGGDLARSWVTHDASSAHLTIAFAQGVDLNALDVTQRLYHGLEDQVEVIGVVLVDSTGASFVEPNLALPTATEPLEIGQNFVARARLSRVYEGVTSLTVYLTSVMDEDDAGDDYNGTDNNKTTTAQIKAHRVKKNT